VISNTAQFFHILINGEGEGLLDNKLFSRSLLDLVKYSLTGPRILVDEDVENDLIELLFEIATKIRLEPDILPAWFHPERDRSRPQAVNEVRRNQFPLFFVLVQYVHHDGQAGDFARTGLLYLTESAAKSKQLETWMIESDLAPQMASGLGALYSRLSRNFPALQDTEKSLPIIALSDPLHTGGDVHETPQSFTHDMKGFFTYLAFWQDTINRCKSQDVEDTLLDHFQVLFVQQLLYPSLLESSDVSGGSTAAVISHLARILQSLENQRLAQRMLQYLLAAKASDNERIVKRPRPRFSMSRRRSLETLAALAEAAQSPSPDLFNLSDLINMSLKSRYPNTVNSSLRLVSVILNKHHPSALSSLFKCIPLKVDSTSTTIRAFNSSLITYFDLAAGVTLAENTLDASYQGALTDAKIRIEKHSCSITPTSDGLPLNKEPTTISPDDRLLNGLLDKLETLFMNSTLTNLGLTQCIMDMAACENMSIYGWLVPSNAGVAGPNRCVTSVVEALVDRVKQWQAFFPEWDGLIAMRREELAREGAGLPSLPLQASHGADAIHLQTTPPQSIQGSRAQTPITASRGRPITPTPKFGSIDNTISSSPTSNPRTPMAQRPIAGSPLRQAYLSAGSSAEDAAERSRSPSASTSPSDADEEEKKGLSKGDIVALLMTPLTLSSTTAKARHGVSSRSAASAVEPVLHDQTLGSPLENLDSDAASQTPSPAPQDQRNTKADDQDTEHEVSLSHVLTTAIILQEFVLEIAAVMQVRGTMIGEVDVFAVQSSNIVKNDGQDESFDDQRI
jgi:hypothetical protein